MGVINRVATLHIKIEMFLPKAVWCYLLVLSIANIANVIAAPGNPEGPIGALVQSQRAVQEENNELLSENLDRRRQQLFRQDMGSRLKKSGPNRKKRARR